MPQIQKVRAEGAGGTCGQSHSWEHVQTQSKIQDPFGEKEGAWLIEMKRGQRKDGGQNPWGGKEEGGGMEVGALGVHTTWWHVGGNGRKRGGWMDGHLGLQERQSDLETQVADMWVPRETDKKGHKYSRLRTNAENPLELCYHGSQ